MVSSSGSLFSTKVPLCYILQAMSCTALAFRASLQVSHVAGKLNAWADMISRHRDHAAFMALLSADRRVAVDFSSLRIPHLGSGNGDC